MHRYEHLICRTEQDASVFFEEAEDDTRNWIYQFSGIWRLYVGKRLDERAEQAALRHQEHLSIPPPLEELEDVCRMSPLSQPQQLQQPQQPPRASGDMDSMVEVKPVARAAPSPQSTASPPQKLEQVPPRQKKTIIREERATQAVKETNKPQNPRSTAPLCPASGERAGGRSPYSSFLRTKTIDDCPVLLDKDSHTHLRSLKHLGLYEDENLYLCYLMYGVGRRRRCPYWEKPEECMNNHALTQDQLNWCVQNRCPDKKWVTMIVQNWNANKPKNEPKLYVPVFAAGPAPTPNELLRASQSQSSNQPSNQPVQPPKQLAQSSKQPGKQSIGGSSTRQHPADTLHTGLEQGNRLKRRQTDSWQGNSRKRIQQEDNNMPARAEQLRPTQTRVFHERYSGRANRYTQRDHDND